MITRLIFICMSIICIILGINLYIDSARLLKPHNRQGDEFDIAKILLADQQAVVPRDKIGFDERISRKIYFEERTKTDHSVIFGSSRVRYFSKEAFHDKLHFVDAVNAATLEDLLVFTHLREKHKQLPKKIYIALDPWMIERANSYTRLVQLSYPNDFIQAVEDYSAELPESSAKIYKTLGGKRNNVVNVPILNEAGYDVTEIYKGEAVGKLLFPGPLQISFDAWITEGTYYFGYKVLLNGVSVDSGNYLDNIQGSPAPHQPRTFVTKKLDAKAGDIVTLEMFHADGKGAKVEVGRQQYKTTNFSAQVSCDHTAAKKYNYWLECNEIFRFNYYNKFITLVKAMLSPSYFQENLKVLFQANMGSVTQKIHSKPLCLPDTNQSNYVFCSDGSVPWPLIENYDSVKVENIVRTVDDGLVPLKTIDPNALVLLKQLTDFFISNGTEVTYVLVPIHPFSYEKWKSEKDSRGFVMAEDAYRKFSTNNGISIVGSYDPVVVGCKSSDFRDWVHPLPRCTNLIVSEIKKIQSSLAISR